MPLKPKVRPMGQHVVLVNSVRSSRGPIPVGRETTIEGIHIDENSRVHYKIEYQRTYVWVVAADLKKA